MTRHLRIALAASAALGAGLLMTACGGDDTSASGDASPSTSATSTPSTADQASPTTSSSSTGDGSDTSKSSDGGTAGDSSSDKSGTSGASGKGSDSGSAGTSGSKKNCTSNDISWSASSESQAGGYFLIKAKAKPGVTCVIPAALPVVAFGSDGTEAGPAEQSAGQPITLKAGVTAYAGVSPKSTNSNGGKELTTLIVSVSDADPNPVSLKVGTYVEDKPIVTSWHTSAADAVPFAN